MSIIVSSDIVNFLDQSERITCYKDCYYAVRNAYCIDKQLFYRNNNQIYKYQLSDVVERNVVSGNPIFMATSEFIHSDKIKQANVSLFIIPCYVANFLHFIIDVFVDYLFYLKLKQKIPTLKCCVHNKKAFVAFVKKIQLMAFVNPNYNFENDIYDAHYDNTHYNLIIFPFKDYGILRRSYRFDVFNTYTKQICNYMNSYSNTQIKQHEYIYISRRKRENGKTIADQNRNLINETDLVILLNKWGFQETFLEDYNTLAEKLYVIQNAKIIIVQSSATCILLSMIDLNNIIILSGPYKLGIFPDKFTNQIKSIKRITSTDYDGNIKSFNVPWKLSQGNFDEIESAIRKLKI